MSASDPTTPPDWLLERYALGELPAEQRDALRQRIDADPTLAARLRDLRNHSQAVLMQHPPGLVAAQIRQRAGLQPSRTQHKAWWLAPPSSRWPPWQCSS